MHPTLQRLVDAKVPMTLNPPATPEAIAQFEQEQGITFPAYYREFLAFANGGNLLFDDYYGLDSLEQENAAGESASRTIYEIPNSLYIIGCDGGGNPLCIDLKTKELVEWDHETSEEWLRKDSIFDYIFNAIEVYESDSEAEAPVQPAGRITDMFCHLDVLYITVAGGKYDGQTIAMYSVPLGENRFKLYLVVAKQINPVTREEAKLKYFDLETIREFSLARFEGYALKAPIEEYCIANPNGIEIVWPSKE